MLSAVPSTFPGLEGNVELDTVLNTVLLAADALDAPATPPAAFAEGAEEVSESPPMLGLVTGVDKGAVIVIGRL